MSNPIKAALSVTGATGAIIANKGFASVVRDSAGVWTCTLTAGVAAGSCAAVATKRGAAPAEPGSFSIAHTSATVKVVTHMLHVVGAGPAIPDDVDFDLILVDLTAAA